MTNLVKILVTSFVLILGDYFGDSFGDKFGDEFWEKLFCQFL